MQKLLRKQLLYFFYCIFSLILCANDCESSDDFAGNCIRELDVWRSKFCLIFSLILRKWLRALAFWLDHFTNFNWNFVFSLVLIRFSCCFPFCSEQMYDGWNFFSSNYHMTWSAFALFLARRTLVILIIFPFHSLLATFQVSISLIFDLFWSHCFGWNRSKVV